MKRLGILFVFALMTSLLAGPATAQSVDELITQAVRPLPEDLQAGATVYSYDPDTGERRVLRQGTNQVECQPTLDDGFTRCMPTASAARRDLTARLQAEGRSDEEVQAALEAATQAGTIGPNTFGTMRYRLYENDDRIQLLWVVRLPNATSEGLGISTASQRDNSLAGRGLPWMMREGTPAAHLMIPINQTALSNAGSGATMADTGAITDPVAQAVLPLPQDLRAGATVVAYDEATGERRVLREGTNMMECQPRRADGFTRCYHNSTAPRRDLTAKLEAEGRSAEEVQAALAAALEAGTIEPTKFGSLSYRLYQEDDRIRLLWVMSLPNANAADLGISTESQRDNALAGQGMPWMMREGTPQAHLMIPINGTEFSNGR